MTCLRRTVRAESAQRENRERKFPSCGRIQDTEGDRVTNSRRKNPGNGNGANAAKKQDCVHVHLLLMSVCLSNMHWYSYHFEQFVLSWHMQKTLAYTV